MNLQQAFEDALSRLGSGDYASLAARDKLLVAIWGVEADVNKGGFDLYYFNASSDHAGDVPAALREIGAHKMAEIVESANAQFGEGGPPTEQSARQNALFDITDANASVWMELDSAFLQYPDNLAALLVQRFELTSVF